MKLIKLRTKVSQERLTVDRSGNGAIRGASVITEGPALGHGFNIDELTVEQVTAALDGLPGRWTHGALCADGLGQHLGTWQNTRGDEFTNAEGELSTRTIADFEFSESAHQIQPDGLNVPAPIHLMDRADEDPSSFGVSIVGHLSIEDVDLSAPNEDEENLVQFARLNDPKDLKRADFVADPAANPTGLSLFAGTPSELAEQGTALLSRITSAFGEDKVLSFLAGALPARDTKDLDEQITGLSTELASARLEVVRLKNEIKASEDKVFEDYLEGLATEASELQSPIDAADLDEVKELYQLGNEKVARVLGDALLKAASMTSEKLFSEKRTSRLEKEKPDEHKVTIQNQAAIAELAGYTVAISEDGNSFTAKRKGK